MPDIQATLRLPWGSAVDVQTSQRFPWKDAVDVQTRGKVFVPGAPPTGGTPLEPATLAPATDLASSTTYSQQHTISVTDLRSGDALEVDRVSIELSDGSALWTFSAHGENAWFDVLTTGEQPPTVRVNIDGLTWSFVVETVTRTQGFANSPVTFGGRSLAAIGGSPYQLQHNWIVDSPTTAAQLAIAAHSYTGVEVVWQLEDWLIPEGSWSASLTPLAVTQAVAAAAGGWVKPARDDTSITVQLRYPVDWTEWPYVPPDVQVHWRAVESDTYQRADQPSYTGVIVSGQQQGGIAYVRLDGTSGADQAPLVTDPLLTDEPALRQRGSAILNACGPQALVTRTLPVRTGAGEPGVIDPGSVIRFVDPSRVWVGMTRSVRVDAALDRVQQTITVERHTAAIVEVTTVEPLLFEGPIPDQESELGALYSLDLTAYRSGGQGPFTWTIRSGFLPDGIAIVDETLYGVGALAVSISGLSLRVVDAVGQMQDTNPFSFVVAPPGVVSLLAKFEGPDGSTTFTDESGTTTLTRLGTSIAISTAQAKFGSSSLKGGTSSGNKLQTQDLAAYYLPASEPFTFEGFVYFTTTAFQWVFSHVRGNGALMYLYRSNTANSGIRQSNGVIGDDTLFSTSLLPLNTWHHFVFQRASPASVEFYINGALVASIPDSTAEFSSTGKFFIAGGDGSGSQFRGYLDNIRLTTGVALYTAPFTPPTVDF